MKEQWSVGGRSIEEYTHGEGTVEEDKQKKMKTKEERTGIWTSLCYFPRQVCGYEVA